MSILKRLAAIYMLLVAGAVAVHFLATQLYAPTLDGAAVTIWRILDPLMVLGVVTVLIDASARKRRLASGQGVVDRAYLETNFTFYFSAMLLLLLLWNWFGFEWVEPRNDQALVWMFIDSTLPLLLGAGGVRLLRGEPAQTG